MKKLIVIIILLFASVAIAGPSVRKIINWINAQEYNKTQLQTNLTWAKLEQAAENRNIDPNSIKPYWHTIENSVWSYFREGRLENGRGQLETLVQESEPDAKITTFGYGPSSVDPNSMSAYYLTEVPMDLERN